MGLLIGPTGTFGNTMTIELLSQPAATAAKIQMDLGDVVTAEVGAMIAMSPQITVETTSRSRGGSGGFLKGVKRMFSGENFFLNHFTSHQDGSEIILGPSLIGDVAHHQLNNATLIVQSSGWLAACGKIDIDTTWQGLGAALFGGEGLFWVKCSGQGDVLLNSFGAIYEIEVDGEYCVDTSHIVAYEETLNFSISKASSGWVSSFMSGEGFVCNFQGRGKIYCQTHAPGDFGKNLGPKLKPVRE
jgi:uncharacterized protein (TIGR00266 family)